MPYKLICILSNSVIIGAQLKLFETSSIWELVSVWMEQWGSKQLNYLFHTHLFCILLLIPILLALLRYKWMTYGEAGTARTAIGSGLIYYGVPRVNARL